MAPKAAKRRIDESRTAVELTNADASICAAVCPEEGAELSSLKVSYGGEAAEIIFRAFDYSECEGWRGRGPWLWPAVGRTFSAEEIDHIIKTGTSPRIGSYSLPDFPGRVFQIPIHGFAMRMPWALTETGSSNTEAWCTCALRATPETKEAYPFDFELDLKTRVGASRVVLEFKVTADENNSAPMPFAAGNHMTFRVEPDTESWCKSVFRTGATKRMLINKAAVTTGETVDLGDGVGGSISDNFYHNGVLGGYSQDPAIAELLWPDGRGIRVKQTQSREESDVVAPPSDYYCVLYAKQQRAYFCVEPWVGTPNVLNEGAPVVLKPGGSWLWEVSLEPFSEAL